MKLIQSIPRETDDVTSDFDNIFANAKDCGILFILLLDLEVRVSLWGASWLESTQHYNHGREIVKRNYLVNGELNQSP